MIYGYFYYIRQQDILMASFGKPTGKWIKLIRKVMIFSIRIFLLKIMIPHKFTSNDIIGQIKSLVTDTFKECIIYTDENEFVYSEQKK